MTLPLLSFLAITQEEAIRSIQENTGQAVDPIKLLMIVAGIIAFIAGLAFISNRQQRVRTPRVVNHSRKLTREIARRVGLKSSELKKLRTIADQQQLESPLVLLLCPSLLSKGIRQR